MDIKISKKNERISGIELLRIIAMFGIVISHVVQTVGIKQDGIVSIIGQLDITTTSNDITMFIMSIFKTLGQFGNIVFVICSAYFLIDKDKTSVKKIIRLVLYNVVISVIYLLIVKIQGYDVSLVRIIKTFAPTLFRVQWFITVYIILYMIHKYLNIVIRNVDKKNLFRICIVFIFMYGIIGGQYYYSEIIGFIMIYFIVAYFKLYKEELRSNKKKNILYAILLIVLFIAMMGTINILGNHFEMFKTKQIILGFNSNIVLILLGVCTFNIFYNINIKNKFINKISSLMIFVYIIHENWYAARVYRPIIWNKIYEMTGYNNLILITLGYSVLYFVASLILAIIFKYTLGMLIDKISSIICSISEKAYLRIENRTINKNTEFENKDKTL